MIGEANVLYAQKVRPLCSCMHAITRITRKQDLDRAMTLCNKVIERDAHAVEPHITLALVRGHCLEGGVSHVTYADALADCTGHAEHCVSHQIQASRV